MKQPPEPGVRIYPLPSSSDSPGVSHLELPVCESGMELGGGDPIKDRNMVEDGRSALSRIFLGQGLVSAQVFGECWLAARGSDDGNILGKPFIQVLAERGIVDLSTSLQLLRLHSRANWIPLSQYKIDCGLAVRFSRSVCRRWLILPFDSAGRYTMVATANPFNRQAAIELQEAIPTTVVWYLARPGELVGAILRVFR
ncbi:MAG TPA: hypothetical protein P5186_20525 [Candidatus Paceibacterota bacterium]|nr:hypothetical protein [Verrucomicrobiota bacterium]HRY50445.1 hypothetical protein [Candidatus Paceibacterota bacterium]HSA01589.1 hypothetical protein [Candidatus Paceibacterota bacterium]